MEGMEVQGPAVEGLGQNHPSMAQQIVGWIMNHWRINLKIFAILIIFPLVISNVIRLAHRKPHPWCTPNLTVSKDGKGDFSTITAAIEAAPTYSPDIYCILIRKGVYHENVFVGPGMINLVLVGEGSTKTILKRNQDGGDNSFSSQLSTLLVVGRGFMAMDLRIEGEIMPREEVQTLVLENRADNSVFYRCSLVGQNHTLYANYGRQFYRGCFIQGRQYFISGNARAVFQKCKIEAVKVQPEEINVITGQSQRGIKTASGFVFHSCAFSTVGVLGMAPTYLGGLSEEFGLTVVMKSFLDKSIGGWLIDTNSTSTCNAYYGEYENNGLGSVTPRTKSSCITLIDDSSVAAIFTVRVFLKGQDWLPSKIPYNLDM